MDLLNETVGPTPGGFHIIIRFNLVILRHMIGDCLTCSHADWGLYRRLKGMKALVLWHDYHVSIEDPEHPGIYLIQALAYGRFVQDDLVEGMALWRK